MTAPRPNVNLTLESPHQEPDGAGGFRLLWRDLGHLWAEMRAPSGTERLAEVGAQSINQWRILVRAAPPADPRRPRPGQRFRMGEGACARHFRIEAVAEAATDGRWLICTAKEKVST